uniref:Uncharacterized protein n=1 Tax=Melopsittacus undulatus TaxID=13146 RepID=A0A8V5HAW0_MELUD
ALCLLVPTLNESIPEMVKMHTRIRQVSPSWNLHSKRSEDLLLSAPSFQISQKKCTVLKYAQVCRFNCQKCLSARPWGSEM